MKKILVNMLIVTIIFCLSACGTSQENVNNLLSALQKEQIVDSNLTLIDTVTEVGTVLFITKTTYYIYETSDNELIAINYETEHSSSNEYDYSVTTYYNVSLNDVEYIDDYMGLENYCSYQNGKKSIYNKYNFDKKQTYVVYESKPLFFKTNYKFVEVN